MVPHVLGEIYIELYDYLGHERRQLQYSAEHIRLSQEFHYPKFGKVLAMQGTFADKGPL